ncbi:hypothetical protein GH714_037578 [Hevea brasiliensis]|uniref:Brix domain-containing protein n=1 Tax=Hevea brasiliensis TaxID=3981 RepID=A0A6A6MRG0_HEVBR|nr:hypothetical protein GH714_037578 [Hevea brasiliensis]
MSLLLEPHPLELVTHERNRKIMNMIAVLILVTKMEKKYWKSESNVVRFVRWESVKLLPCRGYLYKRVSKADMERAGTFRPFTMGLLEKAREEEEDICEASCEKESGQCRSCHREPKDCTLLREDYLECLHHSKEEKKRNNLRDFLNVSGPMGVTHFLILSKTETASYLRVARTPQGPTLTFKIHEYSTAQDVAQSQLRPRCPQDLFKNPPLIVLSGFGSGEQHLKLTTIMFQNIFPAIDINTVKLASCQRVVLLNYNKDTKLIDFRHYSIRLQPVGVSRRIRKFVQNHQVPDLRSLQDVSDFVTKAGYGSESEADDEAATVTLASDLGRVNRASTKSAVKLQEIGPRMTLQLIKVEEGLCSGSVIYSEYGMFIL